MKKSEIKATNYASERKEANTIVLDGPNRRFILECSNEKKATELFDEFISTVKQLKRSGRRERTGLENWSLDIIREQTQVILLGSLSLGMHLLKTTQFLSSSSDIYWELSDQISVLNGIDFNRMFTEDSTVQPPYSPALLGTPETGRKLTEAELNAENGVEAQQKPSIIP